MTNREIIILQTGVANVASVIASFKRLGKNPKLTTEPTCAAQAEFVVLPGVGAFGAGMGVLKEKNLDLVIKDRISKNLPTLAVCLGLQLLAKASEETPNIEGIGLIDETVKRFPEDLRVPHFGWNEVIPSSNSRFIEQGYAYFANSYRLTNLPHPWVPAFCNYGTRFIAAVELGNFLGCQFHPELSGVWGENLLSRWIESC